MTSGFFVQDRIWELEDAERDALALLDRALRLAARLANPLPARPLPDRAEHAVRLVLVFHRRAARAARDLQDLIARLERQPR
ncbi:hypothetical protein [Streptomyces sp. NPDC059994]|uniref:hypothetical protein n=1 Tax=Streptomyces sp. NPDC059994 TaxID=3347029 RepID=UPI0036786D09